MSAIVHKDGMKTSADLNVKELVDKEICDKGFIWNPSNCECECNRSYDIGQYFDYRNCMCRNSTVDKLVEKCTNDIDENEIIMNL